MRKARPVPTSQPERRDSSKRLVMLVAGLAVCWSAQSADDALENAQLALVVRQLNQLEHAALDAQRLANSSGHRYHFDYARLQADITHIRSGISDYLSPPRAQPRDVEELSGHYRTSGDRQ